MNPTAADGALIGFGVELFRGAEDDERCSAFYIDGQEPDASAPPLAFFKLHRPASDGQGGKCHADLCKLEDNPYLWQLTFDAVDLAAMAVLREVFRWGRVSPTKARLLRFNITYGAQSWTLVEGGQCTTEAFLKSRIADLLDRDEIVQGLPADLRRSLRDTLRIFM